MAESLKDRLIGADTLCKMSDRAKARLVAAGLSLVLSAQVALIIVGALVLATRLGAFDPSSGGLGAITLSQPPGLIITSNVEGSGNNPGQGQQEPPTTPPVDESIPPEEPSTDGGPDQPVAGVTVTVDFPIIGSFELPLRIGTSSGNNIHRTVKVRNVALMVSLSRRPVRDLLPDAKKPVHANHPRNVIHRKFGGGGGDDVKGKPGHGHGRPLHTVLHQLLK